MENGCSLPPSLKGLGSAASREVKGEVGFLWVLFPSPLFIPFACYLSSQTSALMSFVGTSRGLLAHRQVLVLLSRRKSHVLLLRGEKGVPAIPFDALPPGQPQAMPLGARDGNGGPVPDGVVGAHRDFLLLFLKLVGKDLSSFKAAEETLSNRRVLGFH